MVVYIIEALNSGNFKIGFSKDVNKRIKQLQTSNANDLELYHCYESEFATTIEAKIHRTYQHLRLSGEWFSLNKDILNDIILDIDKTHKNLKFIKENKI